jgi:hypothetical protein
MPPVAAESSHDNSGIEALMWKVFLLRRLVTEQPWAQRFLQERGALEVSTVDEIIESLRSTDHIEQLSAQRLQLVLELS